MYSAVLFGASAFAMVLILAIIVELYLQSRLSIHTFGASFFTRSEWDPVQQVYSAKAFVLGTLYTSFWALLIAVPVSIGAAVFLAEVAPKWIRTPLGFLIELLAAIPSVVYGLWGIFVLVPWLAKHVETPISESKTWGSFFLFNAAPNGNDFLAASLVLAIMIIPIITGIARDILRAVPNTMREGSYALGATKWETIRRVVLPRARAGMIGAVMLGLGRALGETMAVTMVIGNNPDFNLALFSPGTTLASIVANEFTEATLDLYRSALMEIGFSLLVIALVVNGAARLLVRWSSRSAEGRRT
ncbi:MAG: phosphate ABC transporter permease subunit PstC [Fimbriimonadales bacterium]